MKTLTGTKVVVLVGDEYEDLELWYPKLRLTEAGAAVTVAGPTAGHTYAGKHGYPCLADASVSEVKGESFDGLVIPGGWMPDQLRRDARVLALTKHFAEAGKPLAAICHGPLISISAGVCHGVRMTGSPGIKDDLINAGALWEDAAVVCDRHFVSSRRPSDLPFFCETLIGLMASRKKS